MSICNSGMRIIEFENVSKIFARVQRQALLRDRIAAMFKPEPHRDPFYALKGVSFSVERGESLAVIGSNGAGKSTLLALVARLAIPDKGSVQVNGRVAALLELGSGFHPDLTGIENICLNASLLGMSRKQTAAVTEEIIEFTGIREFINEPLRTYSSGMSVRLAFSVAVHMDPEVLLVDEVLVVGDQAFQAKCHEKIEDLRRRGKTLVCVSHAMSMLETFCDRAIWLDHGELVMSGSVGKVTQAYTGQMVTAAHSTASAR
jgi:ABC-type polysaccharide/polyol phosphate transport system ATPase subunit